MTFVCPGWRPTGGTVGVQPVAVGKNIPNNYKLLQIKSFGG
jgi:hypothetical protein